MRISRERERDAKPKTDTQKLTYPARYAQQTNCETTNCILKHTCSFQISEL